MNASDKWQQTPIYLAIRNNHLDMFHYLLSSGANLQHYDLNGNSIQTSCKLFNRHEMLQYFELNC